MRLFLNSGIAKSYLPRLDRLAIKCRTFLERRKVFLSDRYGASHFLKPILDGEPTAFFTNGDDKTLQRLWAVENGMQKNASLEDILLAQIEAHRAEVFYNLDPVRFGATFVRKLPNCVKRKIAWRAAPSPGADFSAYDLMVCNFPSIIESWRNAGLRSDYFAPGHDPRMDDFAKNEDRPIDVLFVGGYSRHHARRATVLEAVSRLADRYRIVLHLDHGKLTRLADSPLGYLPGLNRHRRPEVIRSVSQSPIFGLDLYKAIGNSKIVLNGAIDMAGNERGNMRCFEAIGCGALLVSDDGSYPDGMVRESTICTYSSAAEAVTVVKRALELWPLSKVIADRAYSMVKERYSKEAQWKSFQRLVANL
jgi:hypothetical protein